MGRRGTSVNRRPSLLTLGTVGLVALLTSCGLLLPTPIYETTTVGIAVSSGPSGSLQASFSIGGTGASAARSLGSSIGGAPLGAIIGAPDPADISLVTLTITGEDRFGVFQDPLATATLTQVGGVWQATVDNLPIGPSLSFSVSAIDAGGTELYSGSSTRVLGGADETINIALYPVTDATPVFFPVIERITRPAEIVVDTTETVSIDLAGTADETLSVEFSSGGGSFTPNPASVALPSSGAGTLDAAYGAPSVPDTYTHSVRVTNSQGNSVQTQFPTVVVYETGSATITIGIAPAVIGLSASRSGSDVTYAATVTDDAPLTELTFAWSFVQTGGTPGATFAPAAANPGTLDGYDETVSGTVELVVTDGEGLSTTVTFGLPAGQLPDSIVVDTGSETEGPDKLVVPGAAEGEWYAFWGLAVSGRTAALGSEHPNGARGAVQLFERQGSTWAATRSLTESELSPGAGYGVAISMYGNRMLVGASSARGATDSTGKAYLYELIDGEWQRIAALQASDGQRFDGFGRSLFLEDGIAIIAASADDDRANAAGSVYVFRESPTGWVQERKLYASDAAAQDGFGSSVAYSDGVIVVGANGDDDQGDLTGAAYVFEDLDGTWVETRKLLAPDAAAEDYFGNSVAATNGYIIIGSENSDRVGPDSGVVYVYARATGWNFHQDLVPADAERWDQFGYSIAAAQDALLIGARGDDDRGNSSGSVYHYRLESDTWTFVEKTVPDDLGLADQFGATVATDGVLGIGGAPWHDEPVENAGTAYVWTLD